AAVVLFNILVAGSSISLAGGVGLFLFESLGGLTVGAALGWLVWRITDQLDDHLIEVTLSMILAYGSYLIAQHFHTSGVMAVIAAGLVYGNFAMEKMSVNTRLSLGNTWDFLGFLCNSLVFLLIGTQVHLSGLLPALGPIWVAFLVVSGARAVAVLVLSPFTRLEWRWQVVLFWSGLRGSIAMALAMALNLPERDQLLLLTFGVVLISVFVQGLTVKTLMARLGIISGRGPLLDYESRLGELIANQRALNSLDKSLQKYHLSPEVHEELTAPLKASIHKLKQELDESRDDRVRDEQRRDARQLMLAAQRMGLRDALSQGLISEEAYLSISQRLGCHQPGEDGEAKC
ncbi:cation:proton antiporter, partial [bacterium]|nr:cation:proton antiporter [bacterium]